MTPFLQGFAAELEKTARYPISKAMTSRVRSGISTALLNAIPLAAGGVPLATAGAIAAASAPIYAGAKHINRVVHNRGMAGRIAMGGGALRKGEVARLAEILNTTPERTMKIVQRAADPSAPTRPISRALTGFPLLDRIPRFISARGLAGRTLDGGFGNTAGEDALIGSLRRAQLRENAGRVLRVGAPIAAGGGAGVLGALAMGDA